MCVDLWEKLTGESRAMKLEERIFLRGFMLSVAYTALVNPPRVQVRSDWGCMGPKVNNL